jgi:hypothetical protein
MTTRERLVEILENKLGIDGRDNVRLRLLGELCLSARCCAAKSWVTGRGRGRTLVTCVDHAIPDSLTLTTRQVTLQVPGPCCRPSLPCR